MKNYIISMCFLLASSLSWAQQKVVSGTIKDATDVLIGVSVYEKDVPNNGVATDLNGKYKITLRGKSEVLVFKYIGYLTREVNVGARTEINVTMSPDAKGLEEVVVVGYGTQKKLTNTGSVSAISGDDLRQSPSASLQNALVGRVPGIITQQQSGQPGKDGAKILIRGVSTPNNAAPLVIVDDLEYAGSISDIDPDQIESFSVLKDAATTAVYGVKGANGVIVITTKRGKVGKPQITVRTENSLQTPQYLPEYLDSYEASLMVNQVVESDLANGVPTNGWSLVSQEALEAYRTGSDPYNYPNIDWRDALLKKSTLQSRNNINVSGGLDKAKYFISAGYLFQDGLVKDFSANSGMNSNYYYKRYNFRSNLDVSPTKSLLLNIDLSGNFTEQNSPRSGGAGSYHNIFNELNQIRELSPWKYPIYNPDGSYGMSGGVTFNNIVGRLTHYGYDREFRNDLTANFRATQKLDFITKGFSVRGVVGYNNTGGFNRRLFRDASNDFPSYIYKPDGTYTPYAPNLYRISLPELTNTNIGGRKRMNWQFSGNYDRTWGNHRTYGLVLYNQTNTTNGEKAPYVFEGYTFRTGYDFKSKYMVELNAGYNGSSAFAAEDRYALFPAVSLGWNLAEEPFFKNNVKFIDLFKIRGSYGLTGNDEIKLGLSEYAYYDTFVRSESGTGRDTYNYSLGDNRSATILGIREGNIGLFPTWEKERQMNIGADLKMFKGALSVEFDVFNRYRYDILMDRQSVPWYAGYYSVNLASADGFRIESGIPQSNIGIVRNKGFETRVTYNQKLKDFSFNVSGNISVSKNKYLEMDEPNKPHSWQVLTGHPIGSSLGYDFIGFYTAEEIADPNVAKPLTFADLTFAGDLKYRDMYNAVDANGKPIIALDGNDRIVMPYTNLPTTILGLTFGFNYKKISFSTTLQSGLNFSLSGYGAAIVPMSNNFREIHKNAWTPTNTENPSFPRLTTSQNLSSMGTQGNISTFWYMRADYLRIKNAELAYSLPSRLIKKVGLNSARVYVNGYNLLTWMLEGENIYEIDPETNSGSNGQDYYPQQKVYNLGLQIGF